MGLLFPIFLLAMGIYILVSAIRKSGRLFSMENIKEDCIDKAKSVMRAVYFAIAGILILAALSNGLQTVLYTNKVTYFKITDAYRETFPELIEDGQLTYTTIENAQSGMACFGGASSGKEVTYGPYSADNEKMEMQEISAFINKAYSVYKDDTKKFPVTSGGMMNCMGGSVDYAKYYAQTDLIDDAGNPVYPETEADKARGHNVYISSFGNERSDSNSASFISKLYGALNPTLLQILSYVFLGLAIGGVVVIFILTRKYTDKEKVKTARTQQVSPRMPSDAFNFDDEPSNGDSKK